MSVIRTCIKALIVLHSIGLFFVFLFQFNVSSYSHSCHEPMNDCMLVLVFTFTGSFTAMTLQVTVCNVLDINFHVLVQSMYMYVHVCVVMRKDDTRKFPQDVTYIHVRTANILEFIISYIYGNSYEKYLSPKVP